MESKNSRLVMIKEIISGGQTGAERAALDVAIKLDIPHGGWIPKGRKTEDGVLPDKYQLEEMPTASYPQAHKTKNELMSGGRIGMGNRKGMGDGY